MEEIGYVFTFISAVIATIVSVRFFKKIMKYGNRKQRFIANAKKNNFVTIGNHVSSVQFRGDPEASDYNKRCNSVSVKYEYYVEGIRYTKYLRFSDLGGIVVRFPYSVNVYYNPKNPKKAVCSEQTGLADQMQTAIVGSCVIWLAVGFILVNFFRMMGLINVN